MIFSRSDSIETAINEMLAAHRAMISPQTSVIAQKLGELQIATLEKAPRDAAKLQALIREKELEKERAKDFVQTQNLWAEIEMLRVVLFLVSRA